MKKEFIIFKEGVTDTMVTILSNPSEGFDKTFKVAKYKYLGYLVYDLNGNLI